MNLPLAQHYCLTPSHFKLDGGAMFGIIPRPLWSRNNPPDEQNRIDLAMRCCLIHSKNKLILLDTGIGDYHQEKFVSMFAVSNQHHPLHQALQSVGFSVDQVTDVVASHLHFDHVGGLIQSRDGKYIPLFPQAILHLHGQHHRYALQPTERDAGSFQSQYFIPVLEEYQRLGKIHWIEGEEGLILEDEAYQLNFKTSQGHTPHMMHAYDHKIFYLADIIPTSSHVHIPWVMGYDMAPGITTKDKRRLLDFVQEKNLALFFEHDPHFWGGTVGRDEKGNYILKEKFKAPVSGHQSILH